METKIQELEQEIERLRTLNSILEEELSDIEKSYKFYMVDQRQKFDSLPLSSQKLWLHSLVVTMFMSVDCASIRKERFLATGENPNAYEENKKTRKGK